MKKKTEKTAIEKTVKPEAPTKLIYVGPTVLGGLTQNAVYEGGIPAAVETIKETCPLVANLFIPIEKYPEASLQIRSGKGAYYSAWKAVNAYKAKNNA